MTVRSKGFAASLRRRGFTCRSPVHVFSEVNTPWCGRRTFLAVPQQWRVELHDKRMSSSCFRSSEEYDRARGRNWKERLQWVRFRQKAEYGLRQDRQSTENSSV